MLAPTTRSVAGPMQPESQSETGGPPNSKVLDKLPDLPPDMLKKKKGKKDLLANFSSADAGGPDDDEDSDIKDLKTLNMLAKSNPMIGAVAAIHSIEKRLPLLAKFAPQTAAVITQLMRQGSMDEIMNQGQPAANPMFGPAGPMSTQPPGPMPMMPPGQPGMPSQGIPQLPAAAPPGVGIGQ